MTLATRALLTGPVPAPVGGTWTPDGTPVAIVAANAYDSFPGLARLKDGRVLMVRRGHGTSHIAGGSIVGTIGAVSGYTPTWGDDFTILSDSDDLRVDDGVSVIDGTLVIAGREYNGSSSFSPFVLTTSLAGFSAGSTWTRHDIAFSLGANHNLPSGCVHKVGSTYVVGAYHGLSGGQFTAGVLRSSSLTDWSAASFVSIGVNYSEVSLVMTGGSGIDAYLRQEADKDIYLAQSADAGATWGSPAFAFDGYGFPYVTVLPGGVRLAVYRKPPVGDTAWRTYTGGAWSSETILDASGVASVYATALALTNWHVLVAYAIELADDTKAEVWSQVFTRT